MYHIGILKIAAIVACLCLAAAPASAQFHIRTTEPADGATDVPLQSVIRFDFSEAVSTSNDFVRSIVVEPRDKVSISQVALLVRDLSQPAGPNNPPAIVEFTVQHEPNTDYTWLVYAVRNADDEFMDTPYTLRYTTASDIGTFEVSGEVIESAVPAKRGLQSEGSRQRLTAVLEWVSEYQHRALNRPSVDTPVASHALGYNSQPYASAKAGSAVEPHTQILLLSDFDLRPEQQDILAAGVIRGRSGSYEIDYVRPGTYWPVAIRYTDELHQTIEAIGLHNPSPEGEPSSITVTDDLAAIDLIVYPFAPSTAKEQLLDAQDRIWALGYDPAPVLQLVESRFGGRTDGTAYGWTYRFYSGYADTLITVHVDPLGEEVIQEPATSTSQRIVEPLSDDFIDSDQALQLALDRGGADLIARYPPENVTVSMFGGNRHWLLPEHDVTQFWDIHILASSTTGVESFDIRLDMQTGETIVVGVEDEVPTAGGFRIDPIYPNPVSTTASIPVIMARAEAVSLTVYDILGRRVVTLVNGVLPAGRHEVAWTPSGIPAGMYALVLVAGQTSESRTAVVAP